MIRDLLSSQAAKLVAACVCPAVGSAALTLGVPPVRDAIHRVTAPAERSARAKPRVRLTPKVARAPLKAGPEILCPTPTVVAQAQFDPPPLSDAALAAMLDKAEPARPVATLTPTQARTLQPGSVGGVGAPMFAGAPGATPQPGAPGAGKPTDLPEGPPLAPPPAPVVPEPAAWALLIAGFGLLGGALRLRRRQARAA